MHWKAFNWKDKPTSGKSNQENKERMSTEATLWTNKYKSTDATKIKKVLNGKYEQLDVNKYENFDEIKKNRRKYSAPKVMEKK